MGFLGRKESKDSSFSEEKEAKRLHPFDAEGLGVSASSRKSFLVLFFKKEHACFYPGHVSPCAMLLPLRATWPRMLSMPV
jgi:hypothetical protein